jgi:hypothetical protein
MNKAAPGAWRTAMAMSGTIGLFVLLQRAERRRRWCCSAACSAQPRLFGWPGLDRQGLPWKSFDRRALALWLAAGAAALVVQLAVRCSTAYRLSGISVATDRLPHAALLPDPAGRRSPSARLPQPGSKLPCTGARLCRRGAHQPASTILACSASACWPACLLALAGGAACTPMAIRWPRASSPAYAPAQIAGTAAAAGRGRAGAAGRAALRRAAAGRDADAGLGQPAAARPGAHGQSCTT